MGSGGFRISIMISIVVSIIMKSQNWVMGRKQVPCLFLMGDSLFDNGNNNLLITQAKANYPPYGIDYPYGPTGRFSNGRNIVDYLGIFSFLLHLIKVVIILFSLVISLSLPRATEMSIQPQILGSCGINRSAHKLAQIPTVIK